MAWFMRANQRIPVWLRAGLCMVTTVARYFLISGSFVRCADLQKVDFEIQETAQNSLPDGVTRVTIEVVPKSPCRVSAFVTTIGPGRADRQVVSLNHRSFFHVDTADNSTLNIAVVMRVDRIVKDPDADPFLDARPKERFKTLSRQVKKDAAVEAFPSFVCLAQGSRATIALYSSGGAVQMGLIDHDPGLIVTSTGNMVVHPDNPTFATITASDLQGDAEVRFLDAQGKPLCSVLVARKLPPPVRLQARFLVGIDFGTSGTSVWRLDSAAEDRRLEHMLDEVRPPTAVFVGNSLVRSTWRYGTAAEVMSREKRGILVTDFKRYLQEIDDTIPGFNLKASELLAWYLQQLVENHVIERLRVLAGGSIHSGDVEWRLTMPVYDSGEHACRYLERLLKAVEVAGLRDYGEVDILLEPECALRFLVHSGAFQREKIPVNARVMVIDSGGGTTDVAIGTITQHGEEIELSETHSCDLGLPLARSQGMVIGRDFGGGDVTRLAGAYAIASFAREKGDAFTDTRYTLLAEALDLNEGGGTAFGFGESSFFPPDREDGFWHQKAPSLYEDIERVKRTISDSSGEFSFDVKRVGDEILHLTEDDVSEACSTLISEYKSSLVRIMQAEVTAGRDLPCAIAFVGGNHILIEKALSLADLPRRIDVEPSCLRTAVVQGATLPISTIVPPSPFPVKVLVDFSGSSHSLLIYDGRLTITRLEHNIGAATRSAGELVISVIAEYKGPRLLRRFTIPYAPGRVDVLGELANDKITLTVTLPPISGNTVRSIHKLEVQL